MPLASAAAKIAKKIDQQLGLRHWLAGEPRPPRGGFDLDGEKIIDWGWICANLPPGPQRALEIGCGQSPVIPTMIARGYDVVGLDFSPKIARQLSGFTFIQGDFITADLPPGFDVIVACSAIEHFGLSGRYGSAEDPDGDIKAMTRMHSLLSPTGIVMLTIPVGQDVVHRPWHRVYGSQRLPLLLKNFRVVQSRFMVKKPWEPWHESTEAIALSQPPVLARYALGEFILAAA